MYVFYTHTHIQNIGKVKSQDILYNASSFKLIFFECITQQAPKCITGSSIYRYIFINKYVFIHMYWKQSAHVTYIYHAQRSEMCLFKSVLQCVAVCCSAAIGTTQLARNTQYLHALHKITAELTLRSVLQRVAIRCSVLQCLTVRKSTNVSLLFFSH